ncbi:MAG: hypothetical protein HFJ79_06205 [Clostridiales bacterium]|nr:hypothetical protein [Clostridiales bacterium]
MWGHFGFSYIGLIYLLLLFIPNGLWSRNKPIDYHPEDENRVLALLEKVGQVGCTCAALIFRDYNLRPFSPWSLFLILSFLLMILYEIVWIRYFCGDRTTASFYRPLWGIPVPLASLPVAAFLLLGIYGRVIWLTAASVILGIGHIGIHLQHARSGSLLKHRRKGK